MSFRYLEFVLLKNNVLPVARWEVYDTASVGKKYMILDATALDNLEILRRTDGKYEGSLLHFVDKTSTAFGYRLLKKWLVAPLMDVKEIKKRQDIVDLFLNVPANSECCSVLKLKLKKLPDMERLFTKLCSLGTTLQTRKAVLYQDYIGKRISEFFSLLEAFSTCQGLIEAFRNSLQVVNEEDEDGDQVMAASDQQGKSKQLPERLQTLLTYQKDGGTFPDLQPLNEDFMNNYVDAEGEGKKQSFTPKVGKSKEYDGLVAKRAEITDALEAEYKLVVLYNS